MYFLEFTTFKFKALVFIMMKLVFLILQPFKNFSSLLHLITSIAVIITFLIVLSFLLSYFHIYLYPAQFMPITISSFVKVLLLL